MTTLMACAGDCASTSTAPTANNRPNCLVCVIPSFLLTLADFGVQPIHPNIASTVDDSNSPPASGGKQDICAFAPIYIQTRASASKLHCRSTTSLRTLK